MAIEQQHKTSGVDGALRWIGDLDHPFYQDERHRFVWYEASAIGFQLMLLSQFLIGGLAMLIFGRDAVLYTLVGIVPAALTSIIVVAYAQRRGAQFFAQSSDLRRSRGFVALGIVAVWVAGLARVAFELPGSGDDSGFDSGLIVGAACGVAAGVGFGLWAKRKHRLAEEAAVDDE